MRRPSASSRNTRPSLRPGAASTLVYYFMGEIYIQQGKYNNADIALSTALYHSPNIADWWSSPGLRPGEGGQAAWALEAYNKALALNPNHVDAANAGKSPTRGSRPGRPRAG